MALLKIGRIITGEYVSDNYDDVEGYIKLAHRALKERGIDFP